MEQLDDLELDLDLQDTDKLLHNLNNEAAEAQRKENPAPVKWRKRDGQGNRIPQRPFRKKPSANPGPAKRQQCPGRVHSQCDVPTDVSFSFTEVSQSKVLRKELLDLLEVGVEDTPETTDNDPTEWNIRNTLSAEKWKEARPSLIDNMLANEDPHPQSGCQCGKPAVVRCLDCLPLPLLCLDCDLIVHSRFVLHNREQLNGEFLQPVPHQQTAWMVPIQRPDRVCRCSGSIHVSPGRVVAVITINGRYNLSMPVRSCTSCSVTWSISIKDIQRDGYWPGSGTTNFCTLYTTDIFQSYYDLKMAAPGVSLKAYLRMLDARTVRFGRTGKISPDTFYKSFLEWVAVKYEVKKLCTPQFFNCPACSPEMLAVSVDGNRKLYRFKSNSSTQEPGHFDDVFIQNDEEVAKFVQYIHTQTKHASGKGSCGSSTWTAAKESSRKNSGKLDEEGLEIAVCRHGVLLGALNMFRGEIFAYPLFLQRKLAESAQGTISFLCSDVACKYFPYLAKVVQQCPELRNLLSMHPFLSVMHAKAHSGKCEIKWGGAFQEGAGSTIGEEVEQVNSFLSRAAITTKYMCKAGRKDMLTLLALGWNERKMENLSRTLSQRYLKTVRILKEDLDSLNAMKKELGIDDDTVQLWVADVRKWAEETDQSDGSLGALQARIEELAVLVKVRSLNLYKQTDSNKRRHKIRRVILKDKKRLAAAIAEYNHLAEPSGQIVSTDGIIQTDTWPWQSENLHTKRMLFDKFMAVQRLKEEELILCKEMLQHWIALKEQYLTLGALTSNASPVDLSEDAQKGLRCLVHKRLSKLKAEMLLVKGHYNTILNDNSHLEMELEEEEDIELDTDFSSSDEDCD